MGEAPAHEARIQGALSLLVELDQVNTYDRAHHRSEEVVRELAGSGGRFITFLGVSHPALKTST